MWSKLLRFMIGWVRATWWLFRDGKPLEYATVLNDLALLEVENKALSKTSSSIQARAEKMEALLSATKEELDNLKRRKEHRLEFESILFGPSRKSELDDPVFIEKMVRLCHPDRHAGANQENATEVTKKLLKMRSALKSEPVLAPKATSQRRTER